MAKKETKWFKTPKNLLLDKNYIKLHSNSIRLLFNLLSLHNSYSGQPFYQKTDTLVKYTEMSQKQIQKAKKELKGFGIKMYRKGNIWWFDLDSIYKKFIGTKLIKVDDWYC